MDETVKDCNISLFSLYMDNVFSHAERTFPKGNADRIEDEGLHPLRINHLDINKVFNQINLTNTRNVNVIGD